MSSPPPSEHLDDNFDEDKLKSSAFECKWTDCDQRQQHNLPQLVNHLNHNHLNASSGDSVRYKCLWEGCTRHGLEQPSRFALISHCRTHTGEKPYFCPIPECEKHFTRSDALAKHVKGVHDLHVLKDAVLLNRDRVRKGRMEANFHDQDQINESEFLNMIEQDYQYRVPWWFSNELLTLLEQGDAENMGLNTKQFRMTKLRHESYKQHLEQLPEPLAEQIKSYNQLQEDDQQEQDSRQLYERLSARLATASKINGFVTKQLASSVKQRRELWLKKQILLDNNIKLSIPPKTKKNSKLIVADRYDDEVFDDIRSQNVEEMK